MSTPNRIQNVAGSWPDGDKYMQNWDFLEALARGNFLLNPGLETWGLGTSFTNPADATVIANSWTLKKGGTTPATADVTRESTTKDTGQYGGKIAVTAGSANSYVNIQQSIADFIRFGGETVLFGMKVKVATGSRVRLSIYDGATTAYSAYHTGDGTWQKLSVALAAQSVPTELTAKLECTTDFTDSVYFDSTFLYCIPSAADSTTKAALGFIGTDDVPQSLIVTDAFQARLTLASATPVTTTDQTAKTTIYLTPYKGRNISLYDGATWKVYTLAAEISIAVPATTSTMYDLFVYLSSSVLTLEAVAWTNDTTRATALATQDGVLCKSGTLTKRYVGSFRTTGSSGQTEDSLAKRYVWNYYNRLRRVMRNAAETTNSWTHNTAVWRQANANAANQLDFIIGVSEDSVQARVLGFASNTADNTADNVGIGLDSTTQNDAQQYVVGYTAAANRGSWPSAHYDAPIAVGRHYLAWVELGRVSPAPTFYGDNGGITQIGISGEIFG